MASWSAFSIVGWRARAELKYPMPEDEEILIRRFRSSPVFWSCRDMEQWLMKFVLANTKAVSLRYEVTEDERPMPFAIWYWENAANVF